MNTASNGFKGDKARLERGLNQHSKDWSEGQQRTEQAVNSPHPLTTEVANPVADSPDTRPVANALP